MPFQPGNKYGGYRENSGRPSTKELKEIKTAADKARARLEGSVDKIMGCYVGLATSGQDPATTRHAVDKLIPDEQIEATRPININFVRYNNTIQLHSQGVPTTVLAIDGDQEAGVHGVASPVRQGQNGIKFSNFKDVP